MRALIELGSFVMDLCLFLSAISPLLLIGAVRAEEPTVFAWFIGLGIGFTAALLIPVMGATNRAPRKFRITKVENASGEVAAYVAMYILPLLIVGDKHPRDFIAYALCLALIGIIFIRGNLLHFNPWIFIFQRRIFSVLIGGRRFYLIAKEEPRADEDITSKLFGNRFLLM